MDIHDRHLQFLLSVEELRSLEAEVVILVEGKKDVIALRAMGINAPIIKLKGPDGLVVVAERTARSFKKMVILTDWDRSGGQISRRVQEILKGQGIELNTDIRKNIARAVGNEVRTVEGLVNYLNRAQQDKIAGSMLKEKDLM